MPQTLIPFLIKVLLKQSHLGNNSDFDTGVKVDTQEYRRLFFFL